MGVTADLIYLGRGKHVASYNNKLTNSGVSPFGIWLSFNESEALKAFQ